MTTNPNYNITPNSNPLADNEHNIMFGWYPTQGIEGKYSNDIETLIHKCNINVFVNLTQDNENLPSYEKFLRSKYPYTIIINYPIEDQKVPQNKDMNRFNTFIDTIVQLSKDHKVFIHCRGGHGRSGMVGACVLIKKGYSAEKALETVSLMHKTRAYIPDYPCPQTDVQREFVRNFK